MHAVDVRQRPANDCARLARGREKARELSAEVVGAGAGGAAGDIGHGILSQEELAEVIARGFREY